MTRCGVLVAALALSLTGCPSGSPTGAPDAGLNDAGLDDAGLNDAGLNDAGTTPDCIDDLRFFARELWGPLAVTCRGCHNNFGLAVETGTWELLWDADPEALRTNIDILKGLGATPVSTDDPRSLLLAMASDSITVPVRRPHPGGRLIEPGGPLYTALQRLLEGPFESCEGSPADGFFAGVEALDPWQLLAKAQLRLTGHSPTLAEIQAFEDGGGDLDAALDQIMAGEDFIDWVKMTYKDLLLLDGPLGIDGNSIVYTAHLRKEEFPNRFYFYGEGHSNSFKCCDLNSPRGCDPGSRGCCGTNDDASAAFCAAGDARIATDLAYEPLELVAHVVRSRRPITEILTADYTLVNPYTAEVYDAEAHDPSLHFDDPTDGEEWLPARLFSQQAFGNGYPAPNAVPHAGLVSSHAFMNRYRTGPTNLNRARTRSLFRRFMGIEIGALLEFTVDPNEALPHNPTMNARTCRTCHAAMDPVAGAFRDWDSVGRIHHGRTWDVCGADDDDPAHDDALCVRPTGWRGNTLDETDDATIDNALAWMMTEVAGSRRFALRTVQTLLEGLTGIDGFKPPRNREADGYDAHLAAYLRQQQDLSEWSDALIAEGYQIRPVIKQIIASEWFSSARWTGTDAAQGAALAVAQIGGHKLITPEQLAQRLIDVTGMPWHKNSSINQNPWLTKGTTFRVLYGGIDGATVNVRAREPFPVMAAVARRMANEMSCLAVAQDFAHNDRGARKLFPHVDVDTEPEVDGRANQEAAFRTNLQHLYFTVLGQRLEASDAAIDASYALLTAVWRDGIAEGPGQLHERCQARKDFYTRANLSGDRTPIRRDDRYVVRAWMAVLTTLLSDPDFLLER